MTTKSLPQRLWLNKALKLEDYLVCSKCNGTGGDPDYNDLNFSLYNAQLSWLDKNSVIMFVYCNKCYGDGYQTDCIKDLRGRESEGLENYYIDPEWNSVEFLLSALSGPRRFYRLGTYFNETNQSWHIDYQDVDLLLNTF